MGVTIPIGFGQVTLRWRYTGATRDSVVTIGYDPVDIDPVAHAALFRGMAVAASRPCNTGSMGNGWSFLGTRVVEMDVTGPLTGEDPTTSGGSAGLTTMPPNVAILVRKVTASGGRRGRGRLFVPPLYPLEASVDESGIILNTFRVAMQTFWDGLRTDMGTAGYPWQLFHDTAPFTPTPVTALSVESRVATQRRRLRK